MHPEVLWAQRSSTADPEQNVIYLTVNLPNIVASTLQCDLQPNSLNFKAEAGRPGEAVIEYSFVLEFFKEILPEVSHRALTTRHLAFVLRKKESKAEYWPRLTKGTGKVPYVRTDFSKWVDEDEQDSNAQALNEDLDDMGGLGGGMGGMGGGLGGGMGGGMGGGGDMGFDMEKMMASMRSSQAAAGAEDDDEGDETKDDEDDDGPPPLE